MTQAMLDFSLRRIDNPDASFPLMYHYICLGRGTADELAANVRANSALHLPWLAKGEAGNRAVIVAGGTIPTHSVVS